jgi:hypothetical protein
MSDECAPLQPQPQQPQQPQPLQPVPQPQAVPQYQQPYLGYPPQQYAPAPYQQSAPPPGYQAPFQGSYQTANAVVMHRGEPSGIIPPADDRTLMLTNQRIFAIGFLPLLVATYALWFVGSWYTWIGPFAATLLMVLLPPGIAAMVPRRPKWGVVLVFHIFLWFNFGAISWAVTYGAIEADNHPISTQSYCYPSYFQGECSDSNACSNGYYCYWGTCSLYSDMEHCEPNSGYNPCYFLDFEASCVTETQNYYTSFPFVSESYGGVMVAFSSVFLLVNLLMIITTMVWLSRTGPCPCCAIPRRQIQ